MKTIKYLFIGALMLSVAAPAMAQSEADEAVKNATNIIKSNAPDKDKQVAAIAKGFKKDPKTLTAIGRAYFNAGNKEKAMEYGNMAISGKNKNYGEAYILMGDVETLNDKPGEAANYYQQAMYFDKTNPEGYRRYAYIMAKVSPKESANALEQLRLADPSYPVDIIAAEIYDNAGDKKNAIAYYEKVDRNKMKDNQFVNYLTCLFFTKNYDKLIEQGEWGVTNFPAAPAIPRLTFYSFTEKQNYPKAMEYAEKLFHISDSVKILPYDLQYYGHAALGNKDYAKAIETFNKLAEHPDANKDAKLDALKRIAETFGEQEDYTKSIDAWKKYHNVAGDMASATDIANLGTAYMYYSQTLSGDAKTNTLKESDKVFADLAAKKPSAAEYANYQRARIAGQLDPTSQQGLAKPFYDKVIELITANSNYDTISKNRLIQAYHYNMSYALIIQKDTATAKSYAAKILALDPEHEAAKQVSNIN